MLLTVFGASHDLMFRNEQNTNILLLNSNFRLSPDGQYLFNGIGNVFDKDLNYITKLDSHFTDIAFDSIYNRFYTSNTKSADNIYPRTISVYDNYLNSSSSFTKVDTLSFLSREITYMAFQDRNLITVSKNDFPNYFDNQYFIQIVPVAKAIELPTTQPVAKYNSYTLAY
ncbi:hypothetical protein [Desulfosporosinus sp. OT]|uniref:hypothetical protein n=1 Tax=Desulfosporosinus sp. OT TaxID=913865 RepID=UPI001A97E620|nr:hypothetical protein [Desulfosporosinus sp. OT]